MTTIRPSTRTYELVGAVGIEPTTRGLKDLAVQSVEQETPVNTGLFASRHSPFVPYFHHNFGHAGGTNHGRPFVQFWKTLTSIPTR
jgi:hypothetical protein